MKKRAASLLLAAALLWAAAVPAAAHGADALVPQQKTYGRAFTDIPGTWCEQAARTCYEAGLMEGASASRFNPSGTLTVAQITVICARLLDLLRGGDGTLPEARQGDAWYQPACSLLVSAGVMSPQGDTAASLPSVCDWQFDTPASREFFVELLSGTLSAAKTELPAVNSVSALPDVGLDTRLPAILSFYNAGILSGRDSYGSFDPGGTLNRGQAAAMLARIVDPGQRLSFTLKPFDLCRDVLDLPPDAVLLYADGEPVTAEVFGSQLVLSLIQWGSGGAQKARQDAIRVWTAYSQSYFALAKRCGITLGEQDLAKARQAAAAEPRYLGRTEAYGLRIQEQFLLDAALQNLYQQLYGDKTSTVRYKSDLAAIPKDIQIGLAPALKGLDLRAVRARAAASPYAYAA